MKTRTALYINSCFVFHIIHLMKSIECSTIGNVGILLTLFIVYLLHVYFFIVTNEKTMQMNIQQ